MRYPIRFNLKTTLLVVTLVASLFGFLALRKSNFDEFDNIRYSIEKWAVLEHEPNLPGWSVLITRKPGDLEYVYRVEKENGFSFEIATSIGRFPSPFAARLSITDLRTNQQIPLGDFNMRMEERNVAPLTIDEERIKNVDFRGLDQLRDPAFHMPAVPNHTGNSR